jgi:hypothetical protein
MASSIINSDDGSVSGTTGLKTTGGDDGALEIQSVGTKYMTVAAGGDISFYESTGTTAKFFWDASAESLGIGTSSPSAGKLTLTGVDGGSSAGIYFNNTTASTGKSYSVSSGNSGEFMIYDRTSSAYRMFIDSSGNVGIGKSSPYGILHVAGDPTARNGAYPGLVLTNDADSYSTAPEIGIHFAAIYSGSTPTDLAHISGGKENAASGNYSGNLKFYTRSNGDANVTERMSITSSGDLTGGSTSVSTGYISWSNYGAHSLLLDRYADNGNVAVFRRGGTAVGTISVTGSATSYNTSSDYRLKEDWQPMSGSIDRLKALNPVNFAWISSGERVDGFLAHEAAEVVPEAVSGEKDAVEAIGNVTDAEGTVVQENVTEPEELAEGQTWTKTEDRPVYQGIDQAKLVPLLTAALQEAVSKIEALETRIAALEA